MPTIALAKAPLEWYKNLQLPPEGDVFNTLPWTNIIFRELCGLKPLARTDGDLENGDDDENEYAKVSDGFTLTTKAYNALKLEARNYFTDTAHSKIVEFLNEVCTEAQKERGFGDTKRKRKKNDETHDCLSRVEKIVGYDAFANAVLAMLNLPGGVLSVVYKIMEDSRRTPIDAWRDNVETTRAEAGSSANQVDPTTVEIPSSGNYVSGDILTNVAMEIFGVEALTPTTKVVHGVYRQVVLCLLQRLWERYKRQLQGLLLSVCTAREKCKQVLDIATEEVTPSQLRMACNSLRQYKQKLDVLREENDENFKQLEQRLTGLWTELGYGRGADGSMAKIKAKRKPKHATDEEMEMAFMEYLERHFPSTRDQAINEIMESLIDSLQSDDAQDFNLLQGLESTDLGVEEFVDMSTNELFHQLGLSTTKRLPFMSDNMDIKWHQLVGIAAMLKAMFTEKIGAPPRPTMLCDDVGLGKTVQTIGIIAMLAHLIQLQEKGEPLPPLLTESSKKYFAGKQDIPHRPSIITAPRTLVAQWVKQIAHFTVPGAFRIIPITSDTYDRRTYFARDGPFRKDVLAAKHQYRVILVVATSTIQTECRQVLSKIPKGVAGRDQRFGGYPPNILSGQSADQTLFGQSFNIMACDELHLLRNGGDAHDGARRISANSIVRVGCTATPLFSGAMNLVNQGAILQVSGMIGPKGYDLCMAMLASQSARSKQWSTNSVEEMSRMVVASSTGGTDGGPSDAHRQVASEHLLKGDPKGYRNLYLHQESIEMAKKSLLPVVIRRTGTSRTPGGNTILNLMPYVESTLWVVPREDELETLQMLYKGYVGNSEQGGLERVIPFENFLFKHKNGLFHQTFIIQDLDEKAQRTAAPAKFWEQWTKKTIKTQASSRMNATS